MLTGTAAQPAQFLAEDAPRDLPAVTVVALDPDAGRAVVRLEGAEGEASLRLVRIGEGLGEAAGEAPGATAGEEQFRVRAIFQDRLEVVVIGAENGRVLWFYPATEASPPRVRVLDRLSQAVFSQSPSYAPHELAPLAKLSAPADAQGSEPDLPAAGLRDPEDPPESRTFVLAEPGVETRPHPSETADPKGAEEVEKPR